MLELLIIVLFVLWLLGYVSFIGITIPDFILFSINGIDITLWNIFMLLIISTIVTILPSPFREIATILLILWILAVLGIIAMTGLPNILVIVLIIGLVFYLFTRHPTHTV